MSLAHSLARSVTWPAIMSTWDVEDPPTYRIYFSSCLCREGPI